MRRGRRRGSGGRNGDIFVSIYPPENKWFHGATVGSIDFVEGDGKRKRRRGWGKRGAARGEGNRVDVFDFGRGKLGGQALVLSGSNDMAVFP
ncbi:hypothetical protein HAX54_041733 [Datura stramonium]|uniref:Uncharacterized protein n=1 Tax=Datura stramonium TaxID=4076 RepID=A0ABS8W259_DATST|nr:hypothetical protein [Datura stramonium]